MRYSDLQGGNRNVWLKLKLLTNFKNSVREERKANVNFMGRRKENGWRGKKEHSDEQETHENRCYKAQRESDLEKWRQMVKTVKSVMVELALPGGRGIFKSWSLSLSLNSSLKGPPLIPFFTLCLNLYMYSTTYINKLFLFLGKIYGIIDSEAPNLHLEALWVKFRFCCLIFI